MKRSSFLHPVAYAGKNFGEGGIQGFGRPRMGSGGGAPRTPENFRKFAKKFSEENCKKCTILAYFSKNLRNHALIIKRVWTKNTNSWEF